MWKNRDRVQEAVALATLSSAFNAHQSKCTEDKLEIRRQLAEQAADRQRMHSENSAKFDKINRVIWIASGIGTAIMFFSSALGQLILKKLLTGP